MKHSDLKKQAKKLGAKLPKKVVRSILASTTLTNNLLDFVAGEPGLATSFAKAVAHHEVLGPLVDNAIGELQIPFPGVLVPPNYAGPLDEEFPDAKTLRRYYREHGFTKEEAKILATEEITPLQAAKLSDIWSLEHDRNLTHGLVEKLCNLVEGVIPPPAKPEYIGPPNSSFEEKGALAAFWRKEGFTAPVASVLEANGLTPHSVFLHPNLEKLRTIQGIGPTAIEKLQLIKEKYAAKS